MLKKLNNLTISSVEENYMAVFGEADPEQDLGSAEYQTTGISKFLPSERHEKVKHSKYGTVGMVNNGQSFYITLREGSLDHLDRGSALPTIIGYVEEGQDVLDKINSIICDKSKRPFNTVRIRHAVVLDDNEAVHPSWFPKTLPDSPIEVIDEQLEAEDTVDERVLKEREREAIARAQEVELELMGDLPSADIKPPKNVLFICQLNPVTEDEDLKTVFARFGDIDKCEVIRDYKTGDSLQYAFIEFRNEEACNKAYVAMQNVLIDDKRIKVDFSQSVSKLWNSYRRKERQTKDSYDRRPQPNRRQDKDDRYRDSSYGRERSKDRREDERRNRHRHDRRGYSRDRSRDNYSRYR
jgi:peptidyl-prolyl cis-trans isomerase-like 4